MPFEINDLTEKQCPKPNHGAKAAKEENGIKQQQF